MIGDALGHYRVLRRLGEGGMGEVYAARDTKLNREVALKVLPADVTGSAERLERLRREAQAVAALSHPSIVTIHSVEEAEAIGSGGGAVHFLTLELVEGRTLDAVIPVGGLPLERFFALAIPLADAVAAAHARGIVHRDLKPSNVMVTPDDRVKVLDFGLAKLLEEPAGAETETATARQLVTEDGMVHGTVAYMSPEQAEGKPLDHRTDLFSLGVLLYEMATGQRPFTGDTQLSVMASVVRDTPQPVTTVNPRLPGHLGRIIRKALEKTPDRRYQTAIDLRNDLDDLRHEIDSGELLGSGSSAGSSDRSRTARPTSKRRAWTVGAGGAALLGLAAAAWGLGWFGSDPGAPAFSTKRQLTANGVNGEPAISPDGEWIVFPRREAESIYAPNIYQQRIGDSAAMQLTRGIGPVIAPVISRDGSMIAFARDTGTGGIYVMERSGANTRSLTDYGFDPSWSPDGSRIVFGIKPRTPSQLDLMTERAGLGIVDVETQRVLVLEVGTAVQPAWSPAGGHIAFATLDERGWLDIHIVAPDGHASVPVTSDIHQDYGPAWSADGQWLYFVSTRGGLPALWRVRVDQDTGEPLGEPEGVTLGGLTQPSAPSLSENGRLVYQELVVQVQVDAHDFDPASLRLGALRRTIDRGSRILTGLEISPDGEWLTYTDQRLDLYVRPAAGGTEQRVTEDLHHDRTPRWSPDSGRLAFSSNRSGTFEIWVVNRDGSRLTRLTDTPGSGWAIDPVWSPDGTKVTYFVVGDGSYTVRADVPYDRQPPPRPLPPVPPEHGDGPFRAEAWSPDGRTLAGRGGIRFRQDAGTFASPPATSIAGTGDYRWINDTQLIFRRGRAFMVVDLETGQERPIDLAGVDPDMPILQFVLSSDPRLVYVSKLVIQGDIWMLEARR